MAERKTDKAKKAAKSKPSEDGRGGKKSPYTIELRKPRAGASGEELDRFEREEDVKIPREYREFLACQNGGIPVKRNFTIGKREGDSVLRLFWGVGRPFKFNLHYPSDVYRGRLPEYTFRLNVPAHALSSRSALPCARTVERQLGWSQ